MGTQLTRVMAIVGLALVVPSAWACGHCPREIFSPEEVDRAAWDASDRVFVGIVAAATSARTGTHTLEIDYQLNVEEVFKGTATDFDVRIYTIRPVSDWQSGMEEITCDNTRISIGDRLLVFSTSNDPVRIGACSNTRVIEGQSAPPRDEVQESLARLRRWRDELSSAGAVR